MPKFSPRKSGNGYTNTYDAHLPVSKLKDAGFIKNDGTVLEYIARVESRKIILEHKEQHSLVCSPESCDRCNGCDYEEDYESSLETVE